MIKIRRSNADSRIRKNMPLLALVMFYIFTNTALSEDTQAHISNIDESQRHQCQNTPDVCVFSINRQNVRAIAVSTGLPIGIKPWKFQLIRHNGYNKYVWIVSNTISMTFDLHEGNSLIIDPLSGEILEKQDWMRVIN